MTLEELETMIGEYPSEAKACCELCAGTGHVQITRAGFVAWARKGTAPALVECWICEGAGKVESPLNGYAPIGCHTCKGQGSLAKCPMCELGDEVAEASEVAP